MSEHENERLVSDADREEVAAEGMRAATRDHALVRLDQKEVKARMVDGFDRFIKMGFEVHLIGVKNRDAVEYKILLAEDGADDIPIRAIQQVADELRLDIFIEKGLGLAMYARW